MELKSEKRTVFTLDHTDKIMWNGHIYQLMTNRERDDTYPVLNKKAVDEYIANGLLIKEKSYVTDFTGVHVTIYKLAENIIICNEDEHTKYIERLIK